MEYNIFLDYNNTTARIPVLPEEIEIKSGSNNDTTNVLGVGEINLIKDMKLTEISFKSFFPNSMGPYVVVKQDLPKPSFYTDFINQIRLDKKPVRLVLTGFYDINMLVTIEKFSTTEKGGEPGDIYYDISFKEYKEYMSKELNVVTTNTINPTSQTTLVEEKTKRPSTKEPPKTYTVTSGDSLWKIAKKETGDGSRWKEIAEKNGLTADYTIYPGQNLKLG